MFLDQSCLAEVQTGTKTSQTSPFSTTKPNSPNKALSDRVRFVEKSLRSQNSSFPQPLIHDHGMIFHIADPWIMDEKSWTVDLGMFLLLLLLYLYYSLWQKKSITILLSIAAQILSMVPVNFWVCQRPQRSNNKLLQILENAFANSKNNFSYFSVRVITFWNGFQTPKHFRCTFCELLDSQCIASGTVGRGL